MVMRKVLGTAMVIVSISAQAAPSTDEMWKIIQQQQAEIEALKAQINKTETKLQQTEIKVAATADAVEEGASMSSRLAAASWAEKTTLGGYGEHHFNHFRDSDDKIDAHRFVIFMGHQFTDSVSFFSELEVEHGFSGEDGPGEVELEQAYIKWDYNPNHSAVAGQFLVPVGILNETHEPNTFYGTERNVVEKYIVPSTWWETGIMLQGELAPGLMYNAALHSGLAADDGGAVRGGRQKSAKAIAEDLAYTARLKYTGIAGLELAATYQYQTEITQGAAVDNSSGSLWEAHAVFNRGPFAMRALYASWDIDGDGFSASGRDTQEGWYLEPSYKVTPQLGLFVRYSEFNNSAGDSRVDDSEIWDYGANYWLSERVVLKADYSNNKDIEGDDNDSFNLGVGWSF
ncbi:MAG: porin [Exilibacterium sp.]